MHTYRFEWIWCLTGFPIRLFESSINHSILRVLNKSVTTFMSWILLSLVFCVPSNALATVVLDLVCENTAATQSNFQKEIFEVYPAATDTYSTRYLVYADGRTEYIYPSDEGAADRVSRDGFIIKNDFYNLDKSQAFIEGVFATSKYLDLITFHRSANDTWAVQISKSGNYDNKLFHRVSYYECMSLRDTISDQALPKVTDSKITPNTQTFVTSYYTFPENFTAKLKGTNTRLNVSIGVSTQYDATVINNVEMHQLSLRSEILSAMSEHTLRDIEGKAGRDALAEQIMFAINKKLEILEGFGGVEGVFFTSFILQ